MRSKGQFLLKMIPLAFLCILFEFANIETRSNYSKLHNFITSKKMVKNVIKPCQRLFLYNINKNMQKKSRGKIFFRFAGIISLISNPKLCNFITLWKMIKAPKTFLRFFPCKISRDIKTVMKLWPQTPFT